MRVAPVGWAFETLAMAALTAEVTHNHPEGVKGAQPVAAAIFLARNGETKAEVTHNHPEGVKGVQAVAAAIFLARNGETKAAIKAYVEEKYGYDLSRSCDEIRPTYAFDESCQGIVQQAFAAFLESVDFESAIRLAVSLGGDSDTLACVTGGVAEAFYGMKHGLSEVSGFGVGEMRFGEEALMKLPEYLRQVVDIGQCFFCIFTAF